MRKRLIAGVGANFFGLATSIGLQLISLPLFLHFWSTSKYGTWLMLSAIPSYLSMADVGMVTAAGNKMTMAMGAGDLYEANKVFQSAQIFMVIVCGVLALFVMLTAMILPLPGLVSIDQRIALSGLCFGVLVALFGGLSEAVFKSTERYAKGAMISNYVRLGEWLGFMVGLMTIGSFSAVAISGLACRLVGTLMAMMLASRGKHGLHWGVANADRLEIRKMVKPAVSFMAFPLANALSFQGVTLMVGGLFGPIAVALFNTYRTIARIAVQVTALFSHALWPEFSRLHGQKAAVNKLFRHSSIFGALQAIALSLVIYFISPWVLKIWTHSAIEFNPLLMLIMLIYSVIGGAWHIPRVLLMATNQHVNLAYWTLASGVLSLLLTWLLSELLKINGAAVAMLLSELFIAIVCFWLVNDLINENQTNGAVLQ